MCANYKKEEKKPKKNEKGLNIVVDAEFKDMVDREAAKLGPKKMKEYVQNAIVHYMNCPQAQYDFIPEKSVNIFGIEIKLYPRPKKTMPDLEIIENARKVMISANIEDRPELRKRKFRSFFTREDVGILKLIDEIEDHYKFLDTLVESTKRSRQKWLLVELFDHMLYDYKALQIIPEYRRWISIVYWALRPQINEYYGLEKNT